MNRKNTQSWKKKVSHLIKRKIHRIPFTGFSSRTPELVVGTIPSKPQALPISLNYLKRKQEKKEIMKNWSVHRDFTTLSKRPKLRVCDITEPKGVWNTILQISMKFDEAKFMFPNIVSFRIDMKKLHTAYPHSFPSRSFRLGQQNSSENDDRPGSRWRLVLTN